MVENFLDYPTYAKNKYKSKKLKFDIDNEN